MLEPYALRSARMDLKGSKFIQLNFTYFLEMVPWNGCKAAQIASAPRTEDCVGCKRCESACPTDFLSVRVYLGSETTRSMGLAY